jgi:hypothetical protein
MRDSTGLQSDLAALVAVLVIFGAWSAWVVGAPLMVQALPQLGPGTAEAAPATAPLCGELDLRSGDLRPGSCAFFGGFAAVWTERCLASDACHSFYVRNESRCANRPVDCAKEYRARGGVV